MAAMPQSELARELTCALVLCVNIMYDRVPRPKDMVQLEQLISREECLLSDVRSFIQERGDAVFQPNLAGPYPGRLAEIRDTDLVRKFIQAIARIDAFCDDQQLQVACHPHLIRYTTVEAEELGYMLKRIPSCPSVEDIKNMAQVFDKCLPLSIPRTNIPLQCVA